MHLDLQIVFGSVMAACWLSYHYVGASNIGVYTSFDDTRA